MRVAVVGVGGVGGYFGGRLAEHGEDVWFLARGETLEALRTNGLRVDSIAGDLRLPAVNAAPSAEEIGQVDVVLLAVKAWQVPGVASSLKPLLGRETAVLPLQNGVEATGELSAVLAPEQVLTGMCRIISRKVGPAHIEHLGAVPTVAFGEQDGRGSPRVEALGQAFVRAGVAVEWPTDLDAALWEKFLFISAFSGVGAVTRAGAGAIRSVPETRALLEDAMWEVYRVARKRGVSLDQEAVPRTMAFVDGLPPQGTSSMQRDLMEGRPSELGVLSGAVVRLGRQVGVETPVHRFLYASLLPMERAARATD